jgi:hypothetical protein
MGTFATLIVMERVLWFKTVPALRSKFTLMSDLQNRHPTLALLMDLPLCIVMHTNNPSN